MTDEEKKVLWVYLNSIQDGINRVNEDKSQDTAKLLDKYRELMIAISTLTAEFKVLTGEIQGLLKGVEKEQKEITDNIAGKTMVVLKDETKKKKQWYQFWIKDSE